MAHIFNKPADINRFTFLIQYKPLARLSPVSHVCCSFEAFFTSQSNHNTKLNLNLNIQVMPLSVKFH